MIWLRSLLAMTLGLVWLCACGGEPPKEPRTPLLKTKAGDKGPSLEGPAGLPSVIIAELGSVESEIYFARHEGTGLLVTRSRGRWLTGPVHVDRGAEAVPEDQPSLRDVAEAPADGGLVALRGTPGGFLLAWVKPSEGGDQVWALSLDEAGAAKGEARRVTVAPGRVSWIEVLADDDTWVLWEVPADAGSTLELSHWSDASGPGPASRVTEQSAGWHAASRGKTVAVGWVEGARGAARGTAQVITVSADGASEPARVSTEGSAMTDIQLAASAEGYLAAWTDGSGDEPHVMLTQLSDRGEIARAAHPALPPVSGQALVALVGSEDRGRALLAWERSPSRAAREIELAVLDARGEASTARAKMLFTSPTDVPHFVADEQGFATLTLGPLVLKDDDGEQAAPSGPIYVRFGPKLAVRASEPVRVEPLAHEGVAMAGVPGAVHGLECHAGLCSALAMGAAEPALLVLVTLPVRDSPWRSPARRKPPSTPPLATSLSSLAQADDAIAEVAAATLADGRTLLAWVTLPKHAQDAAGDTGPSPPTAQLAHRFIAADGTPGPVQILSERAIAVGGVDVMALPAPKGKRDGVAVIVWTGPHAHAAQVYLSKIGSDGDKIEQKTLTRVIRQQKGEIPNEVYDVDAEPDGHGGLVCTWADTRDGSSEIYLARANAQLNRVKTEKRISSAKGAATEPHLAVAGERIWLTWSQTPAGGAAADIQLARIDLSSLTPVGSPRRLSESPGHSRTPSFAGRSDDDLTLSWIDEPSEEQRGGLRFVALDPEGAPSGPEREVTLGGGEPPSSAILRCDASRCRGVLAATTVDGLGLGAFDVSRATGALSSQAKIVATVAGTSDQDVGLAAADRLDAVYFVDVLGHGGRVRKLSVSW